MKPAQARGVATLAVSGGSTPRLMFQSMARRRFDWSGVQIYQVDERCVPPDDEQSNFRMIRESLFSKVRINRVHSSIASRASYRPRKPPGTTRKISVEA